MLPSSLYMKDTKKNKLTFRTLGKIKYDIYYMTRKIILNFYIEYFCRLLEIMRALTNIMTAIYKALEYIRVFYSKQL